MLRGESFSKLPPVINFNSATFSSTFPVAIDPLGDVTRMSTSRQQSSADVSHSRATWRMRFLAAMLRAVEIVRGTFGVLRKTSILLRIFRLNVCVCPGIMRIPFQNTFRISTMIDASFDGRDYQVGRFKSGRCEAVVRRFEWPTVSTAGMAFALLMISGCTKSNVPAYVPISGTVTFNGETVTGAEVVYTPNKDSTGRAARGIIEPSGVFKMRTSPSVPGVVYGEYAISLVFAKSDPSVTAGPSGNPVTRPPENRNVKPAQAELIPEKYLSPTTSGLHDTVDSGHTGKTDIVLTD